MQFLAYDRGEWRSIPNPFGEGETIEEQLADLGFDPRPMVARGYAGGQGFGVKVHGPEEGLAGVNVNGFAETSVDAEFFVVLDASTHSYAVLVADLPSLAQLMGELKPLLGGEREGA